jgi:hypothetical protein
MKMFAGPGIEGSWQCMEISEVLQIARQKFP